MSKLKPDLGVIDAHLDKILSGEDKWVLTSVEEFLVKDKDGKPKPKTRTSTRTFSTGQREEAHEWIAGEQAAERNVYIHYNPMKGRPKSKPPKSAVTGLAWVFVDIDPAKPPEGCADADAHYAAERQRILAQCEEMPDGIPKPTICVFSGGGYQLAWRLSNPQVSDGTEERTDELERYSRHLEEVFGADNCHNLDRMLRLAGTWNFPNARKREAGRTEPVMAELCWADGPTADLSLFKKAEPKRSAGSKGVTVEIDAAAVQRFETVDDIPELQDDSDARNAKCRVCIVLGHDPDDPQKSRSEPLLFVCCQMHRAGCSDDAIYSVITDPAFAISESVLDKGAGTEAYAVRQIERAHEEVEADAESAALVLDPSDPLPSARTFISREAPELMLYNGDWLDYDGSAYSEVEDGIIESRVCAFLERAKRLELKDKKWEEVPFKPTSAKLSDVLRMLKSAAIRPRDKFEPPCWIGEPGPPAHEVISCANGLLHLPTGRLFPATPSFFTRNALAIAYDPAAPEPTGWLRFLRELWANDPDSIGVLQEVFGYLLVPDTSQQKLFFLKGPARSGKGTIARILRELVGAANACSPSLPSLGSQFGLEPLVGKSLATVSDARDSGRMEVQASIAENLLRITGEDPVSIPRKFKTALDLKLSVRFLIMSNLRPKLPDASGALANRFVPIVMTESFLNREDPGLTAKLLPELPGILNWAIEGWRRLRDRGYFEPSATGRALLVELIEDGSPVISFVHEDCELDPLARVSKEELYAAYKDWRLIQGMSPVDARVFGKDLTAAFPKVAATRPVIDGAKVRLYTGIRLAGTEAGRARRLLEAWARTPSATFGDEHERAFERLWGEEDSYSGAAWEPGATW